MTVNTSAQLTKLQDEYAVELGRRRRAEAKLLEIKTEIALYSAIDRDFAKRLVAEIERVIDID